MIPFNKPHLTGKETHYIYDAVYSQGKLSGNGKYTKLCQEFFQDKYHFSKTLLTTSCTDALEMSAILVNIQKGDEVIMPSYTFVSTANAFILRGAKVIFVDSLDDHPNIDPKKVQKAITAKTKAIVVVHYAGIACDMDKIMALANKHNLFVIEDAAQAIDSFYKDRPLGGIGHLSTFSFHETKNISSGEGGMLVINDKRFIDRSEIIWEKGTNRASFFRGEVNKYGWVDIGSSFLPSELTAAFLYAQLEHLNEIQAKRKKLWTQYNQLLANKSDFFGKKIKKPVIPNYATNNAHMFYLLLDSLEDRNDLIKILKNKGLHSVFHYLPLNESEYFKKHYQGEELKNTKLFSNNLLRLPFYTDLEFKEIENKIV
ncbi:dTDP-4-amino-4,6-dideoxygalactose transaminase [Flammeovirga sp. MY04]|uniref:dTDP-4-amino-4,6-dideoxygalactose transaminase n=1 Tax=Flammeovirga sp. MY04 TaxID=1191459 RepID=UPI000806219C|nr:dTDP-4-amino-4,6-dideoxygalactose transaminase [Flammeovirga sp. MY04]ANQ50223.1 dTDP-4-amino-4,6-dideoxygalactose transaminase [Flammeovirga sp. MY04]